MSESWQASLKRWVEAGLVDSATAEHIARFEAARGADASQGRLATIVFGFGGILLIELVLVLIGWTIGPNVLQTIAAPIPPAGGALNTEALGPVLYPRYVYFFQAAGMVLLVAMIGAIVLTLRHKPYVKRQNIADQIARTKATAIEIVKVRPGQGL